MADTAPDADGDMSSASESSPEPGSRRRRFVGSRRALLLTAGVCGATIVVGLLWIVVTALVARSKLQHAQAELPKLRQALLSGDLSRARTLADDIRSNADSAHALVSGPAWWVAANLPAVGTPLTTARTIATSAHDIGDDVLPGVVELAATVHGSSLRSGTSVHLGPLVSAEKVVSRAHGASAAALARVLATDKSSWLSNIDHTRNSLAKQLTTLNGDLSGASRALRTAIPMMGENGTRRYFVGFENEAESRGLGGLPGAFAIVTVDHGKFTFTHFGNDDQFRKIRADVDLGADYNARYGSADPPGTFQNSDIGPDFRDAGRIWAGMWEKKTGQHVDGAVAVDPTALSYLLRVTGPASLKGGGEVTAGNVVALTQQTQYTKFSNLARRKKYVVDVADAVAGRVTNGAANTADFVRAVSRGARERRLVLWSAHKTEEHDLIAANYGGVLESDDAPFTGFAVVNGAGSKLDYYLERKMSYSRSPLPAKPGQIIRSLQSCGSVGQARATFTLTNDAPTSGLPSYVTIRGDKPAYPTKPGDNFLIVTYYGTPGAKVTSTTVDGKPVGVRVGTEHGLLTVSIGLELPVQSTRSFSVTMNEPASDRPVYAFVQPGVHPTKVNLRGDPCR